MTKKRYEESFGSLNFEPLNDPESGFDDWNKFYSLSCLSQAVIDQNITLTSMHVPSIRMYERRKNITALWLAAAYRRVEQADTDYPIIVDRDNEILDGTHRVCKAILEWKEWIPCYRIDLSKVTPTKQNDE